MIGFDLYLDWQKNFDALLDVLNKLESEEFEVKMIYFDINSRQEHLLLLWLYAMRESEGRHFRFGVLFHAIWHQIKNRQERIENVQLHAWIYGALICNGIEYSRDIQL